MNRPTIKQRLELRQSPLNEYPVMKHKWRNLLFLHWEYDAMYIQQNLPEGLFVDTFDNKAYIAITPFFMYDVRPVLLPSIPAISDFKEVNVGTYVHDVNGVPGIWFYSLDANQPIAVQLARQLSLPYFHSNITTQQNAATKEIYYRAERRNTLVEQGSIFRYNSKGNEFFASSESLEFFLTERYLLYAYNNSRKQLITGRVHHMPYPLYEADVKQYDTKFLALNNLPEPSKPPDNMLYSPGVDVDIYFFKGLMR
jgi:uncharacterized protein YqjF (DUF2071 family)